MKLIKLIRTGCIVLATTLGSSVGNIIFAQCSGTMQGNTTPCVGNAVSYFLTSPTGCSFAASDVSGDNTTRTVSGSQITWLHSGSFTINFHCSCGAIPKTINVLASPVGGTAISPTSQTICSGQTPATLSVTGTITGSISWQKKLITDQTWTAISGTVGLNPLTTVYISNTQTYQYQLVATQCGAAYSPVATVTVNPPLTAPPTPTTGDVTNTCGNASAISISTNYASGYTIKHNYYDNNGVLVSTQSTTNPTGSVYISNYTPPTSATIPQYQLEAEVEAQAGCAMVRSSRKTINYTWITPPQPPSSVIFYFNGFGSPATSINVCAGELISVTAANGSSNYLWYKPSDAGHTNAVNSSSSYSNFAPENGQYYVQATWNNPCGGTSTVVGTFQVNLASPSLQISNPGSTFCLSGTLPTYSATVSTGASNSTYQWSLSNGATGTNSTYPLPNNSTAGTYTLNCTVLANFTGQCLSQQTLHALPISVTLTQPLSTPETPTTGDISNNCNAYGPISISTNYPVTSGVTIRHYYYDHNGVLLNSVVATNLITGTVYTSQYTPPTFAGSTTTFQLQAEVGAQGSCPALQSPRKTINYTVIPPPQPPASLTFLFNSTPVTSINACTGELISVTASGANSNYLWYKPSDTGHANAVNSSGTYSNFIAENGTYYVQGTWNNPCGGTSTVLGTFQVNVYQPTITISPASASFCQGSTQSFTPSVSSGATNISAFSWQLTGPSPWTGTASVFSPAITSNPGSYTLVSTASADFVGLCQNAHKNLTSNTASLSILSIPSAPLVSGNASFGAALLTLTASGIFPLPANYNWYVLSAVTHGTNLLTGTISQSVTNYGQVSAVGTNGCEGPKTSFDLNIFPLPQIVFVGPNYIPVGGSTTLSTGTTYDSYVWGNTLGTIAGANQQTLIVTAPDSYHVLVSKMGVTASVLLTVEDNLGNQNLNSIVENDIQISGITAQSQISQLVIGDKIQKVQYFDGLGRGLQSVTTQGSPVKNDIVQPVALDNLGREATKFLPYVLAENTGRYKASAVGSQGQFYVASNDKIADDAQPYTQTIFEPSPLNRPGKVGAAGAAWQPLPDLQNQNDNAIKKIYGSNEATEVLLFGYNPGSGLVILSTDPVLRYYGANQLYANKTLDEKNNQVIEYIDKLGHTVCKKVQYGMNGSTTLFASTYYVYNDLGNLVVVLPPEGVNRIAPSQN